MNKISIKLTGLIAVISVTCFVLFMIYDHYANSIEYYGCKSNGVQCLFEINNAMYSAKKSILVQMPAQAINSVAPQLSIMNNKGIKIKVIIKRVDNNLPIHLSKQLSNNKFPVRIEEKYKPFKRNLIIIDGQTTISDRPISPGGFIPKGFPRRYLANDIVFYTNKNNAHKYAKYFDLLWPQTTPLRKFCLINNNCVLSKPKQWLIEDYNIHKSDDPGKQLQGIF